MIFRSMMCVNWLFTYIQRFDSAKNAAKLSFAAFSVIMTYTACPKTHSTHEIVHILYTTLKSDTIYSNICAFLYYIFVTQKFYWLIFQIRKLTFNKRFKLDVTWLFPPFNRKYVFFFFVCFDFLTYFCFTRYCVLLIITLDKYTILWYYI